MATSLASFMNIKHYAWCVCTRHVCFRLHRTISLSLTYVSAEPEICFITLSMRNVCACWCVVQSGTSRSACAVLIVNIGILYYVTLNSNNTISPIIVTKFRRDLARSSYVSDVERQSKVSELQMRYLYDVMSWTHFPHYRHFLRETTGHLSQRANSEKIWCYFWCESGQHVTQIVVWVVMTLIWRHSHVCRINDTCRAISKYIYLT